MADPTLTANEITERLAVPLTAVLSQRRTLAKAAEQLADLDARSQQYVIQRVAALASTNAELGYQFAHHAAEALDLMSTEDVQSWAKQSVEIYDSAGLFAATSFLEQPQRYANDIVNHAKAVRFDDVAGMLSILVNGLAGRRLKLETGETAYTDTETIYLPSRVNRFGDARLNRALYKAMATYLWAQGWYGTFRLDKTGKSLEAQLDEFDNPRNARDLFEALEVIRIKACVARDLPGLHREWQRLQSTESTIDYPPHWQKIVEHLEDRNASAQTSLELLPQVIHDIVPSPFCYQGKLMPAQVARTMALRIEREKERLKAELEQLATEQRAPGIDKVETRRTETESIEFKLSSVEKPGASGEFELQLSLGGQSMGISPELEALLQSILQDLGGFPLDYLVPAGDNEFDPHAIDAKLDHESENDQTQATWYPEWDYQRQQYRKDWCALLEQDIEPEDNSLVRDTLKKYHGELHNLRKAFEALRGEDRVMKRQPDGDDIDFDAVVHAMTDLNLGMEMPQRLFVRNHRHERNIAVMFMVDMSGSTKGWVNDAEREALVLLCQALEILGDRYAIYGFSGMTRKRCDLYRIKSFDEPYSRMIDQRIAGIKARDYTRMGVTIRHLSRLLSNIDARTKLLITLSDGKPDDFDGYRGDYGIEDTRKALIEAKRQGIHSFCITIDDEARDYLPHMYGAVNYTIIDDVRKLPLKVADVYRRLTFK